MNKPLAACELVQDVEAGNVGRGGNSWLVTGKIVSMENGNLTHRSFWYEHEGEFLQNLSLLEPEIHAEPGSAEADPGSSSSLFML